MFRALIFLAAASAALAQHAEHDERKAKNPAIGNPAAIAAGQKLFLAGRLRWQ